MTIDIHIGEEPLDTRERSVSGCGAAVTFAGIVRGEENGASIEGLYYEAYESMARRVMHELLVDLGRAHPCACVRVAHRTGWVPVGEAAIIVQVYSPHRHEAFSLLTAFMDRLKQDVPIWKKTQRPGNQHAMTSRAAAENHRTEKSSRSLDIEIEDLWAVIDREIPAHTDRQLAPLPSPIDLPPFDQSAVDGYAFADASPGWHPIRRVIAAGDAPGQPLSPGEAARILTGAHLPEGALLIAKQEECEVAQGKVRWKCPTPPDPGLNIRRRGSVLRAGELALTEDTPLTPGSLALLAAVGIDPPALGPSLQALHIATGNELVPPGRPLPPGKIYDANGPMVEALLREHQVACQRQRLGDDPAALEQALSTFSGDLLLISGGSGPGDRDHTLAALQAQGFTIHASRINSRPGRPLIFATRGSQAAFGLPGNPLSHFVCFHAFVARAIARRQGRKPATLHAVDLEHPVTDLGDGRRTWTPACARLIHGRLRAAPLDWAHSGDLRPLARANALLLDGVQALLLGPLS